MRVSLVIPAYNEEAHIGACLDSVMQHAGDRFCEVIVVDNASTDRTAEIARSHGARVVHEATKGLPAARECGRRAASGEIIAYIDADTRLHAQWLPLVLALFQQHPGAVSVSGPPRYFDASPSQRVVLAALWWLTAPLAYRVVGYMLYGAHFAVRADALERIGGFDRRIRFYGEDTDLARRLSRVGKTVFSMRLFIHASARRFRSQGVVRASMTYCVNFLWPVMFGRPFSHQHQDIRVPTLPRDAPRHL